MGALISSLSSSTESYIAQTDLLLESEVNKTFIMTQLISTLARISRLHLTHVEWWEESPTTAPPSARPAVLSAGNGPGLASAEYQVGPGFKPTPTEKFGKAGRRAAKPVP